MPKRLTVNQIYVLNELEHRGLYLIAEATREAWKHCRTYYLDSRQGDVHGLRRKFKRGNNEALK